MISTYQWEDEMSSLQNLLQSKDQTILELTEFRNKLFSKNQDKAIQVLNKILHAQLAMALSNWRDIVTEMKRQETVKERFINKWR